MFSRVRHIVNHTHENKMREEVHAISRELQWYNQLVGHVGIHGQRRFTEALEKRLQGAADAMGNKNGMVWAISCSPAAKNSSTRPQQD
ncbi:hypothetical protein Taro_049860, partial [Colocasia esculenta]|nr:hypothetical protein [Colocasia esculenta]